MGATQDDETVRRGVRLLRRVLTGTVITFVLVTGQGLPAGQVPVHALVRVDDTLMAVCAR